MKAPSEMDVVLIGGGHAHVEVLRSLAMKPVEKLRLTVVARDTVTPYSGMLPGYLAGIYRHADAHIDLHPLCARSGARLIHASATGLDVTNARCCSKAGHHFISTWHRWTLVRLRQPAASRVLANTPFP